MSAHLVGDLVALVGCLPFCGVVVAGLLGWIDLRSEDQ